MYHVLTLVVFHGILNSILNKLSSQNDALLYVHNSDQIVHNNISHCPFSHEDHTFCYFFYMNGVGNGNPLHHSCLENPMDRGAGRTTVHRVVKSCTRLSN